MGQGELGPVVLQHSCLWVDHVDRGSDLDPDSLHPNTQLCDIVFCDLCLTLTSVA